MDCISCHQSQGYGHPETMRNNLYLIPKQRVAGSIPVSRSKYSAAVSQKMVVGGDGCFVAPVYLERDTGRCSSAVERVLGKDEVTGSSPVIGSRSLCKLFLKSAAQSGPREAESL